MPEGGSIVNITSQGIAESSAVLLFGGDIQGGAGVADAVFGGGGLAPQGIAVNAVSGGYVRTGALDHFPNRGDMLAAGENTPAGRMVSGEDIARVAAFPLHAGRGDDTRAGYRGGRGLYAAGVMGGGWLHPCAGGKPPTPVVIVATAILASLYR